MLPSQTTKSTGIDRQCIRPLLCDAEILSTLGLSESEKRFEAFAMMVIERCATVVGCMRLIDEVDVAAEAYNVGISDGAQALLFAAALLRRLQA